VTIERSEAAQALRDVETIAERVRRSRVYQLASLLLILWGTLIFFAYLACVMLPRQAGLVWICANALGVIGSIGVSVFLQREHDDLRPFDWRALAALLLLFAFGAFWAVGIARLPGRELNAFWATYFMLVYSIAGLWVGFGFVVIGVAITALTLFAYFLAGPWFELSMAFINGGGLILGGLWMRKN
jgi:hypothetical protein